MFLLLQTQTFVSKHKGLMNLKTAIYILGGVLLSTFVSCLGDGDNSEIIYSSDAEIISFSIKNDSIDTSLGAIKFSIDQVKGLIYNKDSANYGLELTDRVIVTYSTASGSYLLNITDGDSVWVKSGDSIDLVKPVILQSYALNGDAKKYTVTFNIHTIDPDSIGWKQVNNNLDFLNQDETKIMLLGGTFYCFTKNDVIKLNTSIDYAVNWTDRGDVNLPLDAVLSQIQLYGDSLFACTSSGDWYGAGINDDFISWTKKSSVYPVKNIFGSIAKKNLLVLAVEKDGISYSVFYDGKSISEPVSGSEIPNGLPVSAFSSISYERANAGYLTIIGGDSGTSWGTTNGSYWAPIGNLPFNMQEANVFRYDNKFYLLNGIIGDTYNKSVYTSIDGSNTWQISPSKINLPDNYIFRTGASVVVSSDNMIYIIGGKNGNNPVTDVWRGRLNKLN